MVLHRLLILGLAAALLLAACGGGGGTPAGGESFSFDVSGDVTAKLAAPDFTANYSKDDSAAPVIVHQLWFGGDGAKAISILFYGEAPPAAGTFTLTSDFSTEPGTVSLLFVDNSDGVKSFIPGSGTVTLTTVGERYSGSVDAALTGGPVGSQSQNVTVKGTFTDIQ